MPALYPFTNDVVVERKSICTSRLRDIALGVLAYTDDHEGRLPPVSAVGELRPMIQDRLPSDYAPYHQYLEKYRREQRFLEAGPFRFEARWEHFSADTAFECPEAEYGRRGSRAGERIVDYEIPLPLPPTIEAVRRPAETILVADDTPRHAGGRNCVFYDGHSTWLAEKPFQKAVKESRRNLRRSEERDNADADDRP